MFKELIERIAVSLDREEIPYMIIGGQAVLYYGEPRFTKDIDITLGIDFIFSNSDYEMQAIERSKSVKFVETSVKFASLEDVVIHKIIAGRPRDMEDVSTVLLKNPEYNGNYIVG